MKAIAADPPKDFKRHRPVPIVRLQAKAAFQDMICSDAGLQFDAVNQRQNETASIQ
ncbi:hypothetical protein CBA19CS22_34595 [Caballeronia novacaledonica]|uniref:Uncharacterized protein n=1 Tax=Caballeronia novacaledonica TaxID=1544861 RepID=A0ACB5R371_9BURK|nr:hypothetical protein CBA19CS22_34595 [Caballeronia novacaledonica]